MVLAMALLIEQLLSISDAILLKECPIKVFFQAVFSTARETGIFLYSTFVSEREGGLNVKLEEVILEMYPRSPGSSTNRMAHCLQIYFTYTWKTFNRNGLQRFHIQRVQNFYYGNFALRLFRYILFIDKA